MLALQNPLHFTNPHSRHLTKLNLFIPAIHNTFLLTDVIECGDGRRGGNENKNTKEKCRHKLTAKKMKMK
jgi:hypothetical protein